jgi:3-oxoacyl-[acyl-carrier protein] reductase
VALVTGAGTGMGRAIAELFAREGARVAVNYSQSREAAEEVARSIGNGFAVQANVSVDSEVKRMVAEVAERYGRIDFLVNNAGWSKITPHANLDDLTDEIWDHTLNTNLRGAFYCTRACVPYLRAQAGSAIVNIASVAGITGMGSSIVYAASKAGMISMTKSLARALAPQIRVNAVAPGFVRTRFANWPSSAFDGAEPLTPLQRLATVEDIAKATLFLAVDALGTTGTTLVADGGLIELGPRAS